MATFFPIACLPLASGAAAVPPPAPADVCREFRGWSVTHASDDSGTYARRLSGLPAAVLTQRSLTREILTISGSRQDEREVDEEHYFQRELYWGSFSRTVLLPEEVDVDGAEASERHGILMIRLPKVNKKKETKLKVRSR